MVILFLFYTEDPDSCLFSKDIILAISFVLVFVLFSMEA